MSVDTLIQSISSRMGLPPWALAALLGMLLVAWNATTLEGLEVSDVSLWLSATVPLAAASMAQSAVLAVGLMPRPSPIACLCKPFDGDDLLVEVGNAVQRTRAVSGLERPA